MIEYMKNVTTITEIFTHAHVMSGNILGNGMVLLVWGLLAVGGWRSSGGNVRSAMISSSLVAFLVATLFLLMGLADVLFVVAPLAVFGGMITYRT